MKIVIKAVSDPTRKNISIIDFIDDVFGLSDEKMLGSNLRLPSCRKANTIKKTRSREINQK